MRAIISVQHARHRARCAWLLHGASSAKGHCSWMQQVSTAFTQQSSLQAYAWWPESVVTGSSLDASQAQEASQDRIAGGLLQGRRHRYGQRDRPTGAPQGHHVAQVLVLEGQQGPLVDASPQVPCHIVCLLKGHLQQTSTKVTREAPDQTTCSGMVPSISQSPSMGVNGHPGQCAEDRTVDNPVSMPSQNACILIIGYLGMSG